jgi:hypothetical protein
MIHVDQNDQLRGFYQIDELETENGGGQFECGG